MSLRRAGAVVVAAAVLAGCSDDDASVRAGVDGSTTSSSMTSPTTAPAATRDPNQRYEVTATVLESEAHGPEICMGGVADSLPPQCGGVPLVGFDWDDVPGEEAASGTTWGEAHLVGTFDGERFTLTEPASAPRRGDRPDPTTSDYSPACDDPDVVDPAADVEDWYRASEALGEITDRVAMWVSDPQGPWDGPFTVSVVMRPGGREAARERIRQHWDGPLCVIERDAKTVAELAAVQRDLTDAGRDDPTIGIVYVSSIDEVRSVVTAEIAVADDVARRWIVDRYGEGVVELRGILQPVS